MFSTYRCLSQHTEHSTKRMNVLKISSNQLITISERAEVINVFSPVTSFMWGERDGTFFTDKPNEAYEKIVLWRKRLQERNTSKKSPDT